MLKQFVVALFIAFITLTSVFAFAESPENNVKTREVNLALMQGNVKYSVRSTIDKDNSEISTELNTAKMQNLAVKSEVNNREQSGWLLAFALFGFVMLSNRRGV